MSSDRSYRKQYKAYKRLYKELSGGVSDKQLLNMT